MFFVCYVSFAFSSIMLPDSLLNVCCCVVLVPVGVVLLFHVVSSCKCERDVFVVLPSLCTLFVGLLCLLC